MNEDCRTLLSHQEKDLGRQEVANGVAGVEGLRESFPQQPLSLSHLPDGTRASRAELAALSHLNPTSVVGSDAEEHGPFDDAQQAAQHARLLYPNQDQDELRIDGWDVQPADAWC